MNTTLDIKLHASFLFKGEGRWFYCDVRYKFNAVVSVLIGHADFKIINRKTGDLIFSGDNFPIPVLPNHRLNQILMSVAKGILILRHYFPGQTYTWERHGETIVIMSSTATNKYNIAATHLHEWGNMVELMLKQ